VYILHKSIKMIQMKYFDIIFIHPPRNFEYFNRNIKVRSSYFMMPMGLFGLADLLDRNGFSVKIINYTLEKIIDENFSLLKHLKNLNFKIIGVLEQLMFLN
ncbi:MAG: hypothetical protein ACTSPQ_13240, partial [Candidatus Helarchaeota archaeon]